MDAVEQRDGILGLVRLQLADEVEFDVGMSLAQRGPLFGGLLHPVLPKHTLARGDQRGDPLGGMGLADGNQSHRVGLAPGDLRGACDTGLDIGKCSGWIGHGAVL